MRMACAVCADALLWGLSDFSYNLIILRLFRRYRALAVQADACAAFRLMGKVNYRARGLWEKIFI